jgi:hypothetical protein
LAERRRATLFYRADPCRASRRPFAGLTLRLNERRHECRRLEFLHFSQGNHLKLHKSLTCGMGFSPL